MIILRATRKEKYGSPDIRDADNVAVMKEGAIGAPYAGCYVGTIVEIYSFDYEGNKGIFAQLVGLRFQKDGDAFSSAGARASEDDFEALGDGADAPEIEDAQDPIGR